MNLLTLLIQVWFYSLLIISLICSSFWTFLLTLGRFIETLRLMNLLLVVNKIAKRYFFYGRFGVDLIASMPLEVIGLLPITSSGNLKFLGMLKMVRLLRLGRMITFLKANQKLKFSMKIFQLIFFLLITMHWID